MIDLATAYRRRSRCPADAAGSAVANTGPARCARSRRTAVAAVFVGVCLLWISGPIERRASGERSSISEIGSRRSASPLVAVTPPPAHRPVLARPNASVPVVSDADMVAVRPDRKDDRRQRAQDDPSPTSGDSQSQSSNHSHTATPDRSIRPWQLRLPQSTSLASYSETLDAIGIEIVFETDSDDVIYMSGLSRRRPTTRRAAPPPVRESLLVGDATTRILDEKLAARVNIETDGKQIWHLCSPSATHAIAVLVQGVPVGRTVVLTPITVDGNIRLQVVESP